MRFALSNAAKREFYRRKYRDAGIAEDLLSGGELEARFEQLPLLEPTELIENAKLLRDPGQPAFRVSCSGGSLGNPKVLFRTADDWDASVANMARVLAICGVSAKDVLLIAQPFGIWSIGHLALDACRQLECVAIPAGNHHEPEQILDFAGRFEVTAAFATPSLWKSVTACRNPEGPLHRMRILLAGEKLRGNTWRAFEQAWDGEVLELYGSEETDALAAECGRAPGLHILEDSFVYELLGSSGPVEHSQPGVYEGELVITSLYHSGTPLIRYRLGDLVRIHRTAGRCVCGRSEARLEIVGKSQQFVQLFDATKVYFYQIEAAVRSVLHRDPDIQVVIDSGAGSTEVLTVIIEDGTTAEGQGCLQQALTHCSLDFADSVIRGQVELRVTAGSGLKQSTAKGKQRQIIDRRNSNQERGAQHERTT